MKNKNNVLFAYMDDYSRRKSRRISHNIVCFFRNLKHAKQRVVRGFADCDTWDFNSFLRKVFADGLVCFAENEHGYPDKYGSYENWEKELKRIADLVRKLDDIYWDWDWEWKRADDEYKEIKDEVFDWLKENFDDLWD
ncbi:MAG: hypothetical protein IKR97_01715 [Eubacterium sp.]|jgi:hypothetical protein|nr:hypothetical protein [Eubacterium sp.]